MQRVAVHVQASDPITVLGTTGLLGGRADLQVVDAAEQAAVTVVVTDRVTEETFTALRELRRGRSRAVLVPVSIDDGQLSRAVECGVAGVLRRGEATAVRLAQVVLGAARGEGSLPGDLLGRLLEQMGRLQRDVLIPHGLTLRGLTTREADVLRLVADGMETREIASKLSYSERTVKNTLHDLTTRLQLRNRAHAVAYALRHDLI
ncbi:MAG TPA: response regulator transcription factor [Actinoplanes sp.]|nr:response regulator transcription factor [Actinoplanes sp.]